MIRILTKVINNLKNRDLLNGKQEKYFYFINSLDNF